MTTGVTFEREEFTKNTHRWSTVDDCMAGMDTKELKEKYILPPSEIEPDNTDQRARYDMLVKRAIFYNYINRTIQGLTGLACKTELEFEASSDFEYVRTNVDGKGTTLEQAVKRATSSTIEHGRFGLLAEFPETEKDAKIADIKSGRVRPTMVSYAANQIINWGYEQVGTEIKLSLVVLREVNQVRSEDGFTLENKTEYRALQLFGNAYNVTIYNDKGEVEKPSRVVTNGDGKIMDFIPFQFIGAENNDANVDQTMMYDMAVLNVGHLRNSADYENSAWLCGQPQPWFTGLTQNWVEQNFKGGVSLGSGSVLFGPENSAFGIAQTLPNQQAHEAMIHKQDQMVAMGAKMISAKDSFDSATEAAINNQGETSYLETIKDNVESAIDTVLGWMAEFQRGVAYSFSNPTDLSIYITNPQLVKEVRENWMSGLIAKTDAQDWMRKHNIVERTNEEIEGDIESEPSGVNLDAQNNI